MPAQLTAGVAVGSETLLVEIDATRTNWERMRSIVFHFPNNPSLGSVYALDLEDTTDYRAGLRYQFPTGLVVRAGYAIENSPQPDHTVSPFYAALGRNTITGGLGLDWLDVAIGWTTFDERAITTNADQFNGNYRGNEWTVVVTATK
jgi:long-subunit fatty acid transport protein